MSSAHEAARESHLSGIVALAVLVQIGNGIMFPCVPLRPSEILLSTGSADSQGTAAAQGAYLYGLTMLVSGVVGLLLAPTVGALSDKCGRRPLLFATCCAGAFEAALSGLVNDVGIFTVGRLFGGIAQTHWGVIVAATIDVSTKENKSKNLGVMMGLAMGLGYVLGPIIGGFLGHSSDRAPFAVAAGTSALAALMSYTTLAETAPLMRADGTDDGDTAPEDPGSIDDESKAMLGEQAKSKGGQEGEGEKGMNPMAGLALLSTSKTTVVLSLGIFFSSLAVQGFAACGILYLDYKFKWSKQQLGMHMGLLGLSFLVAQAVLLPTMVGRFSNLDIAIGSAAWGVAIGVVYAIILDPDVLFWLGLLVGPVGLQGVVLVAMVSDQFGAEVQGRVSGCLMLLDRLARILGAVFLTSSFAALTDGEQDFPEVVPLTLAFFTLLTFCVMFWYRGIFTEENATTKTS